jgi:hypothetical protein
MMDTNACFANHFLSPLSDEGTVLPLREIATCLGMTEERIL